MDSGRRCCPSRQTARLPDWSAVTGDDSPVQGDGQDVSDAASGYGNAYEGEEDDGDPEGVAQATAVLHIE